MCRSCSRTLRAASSMSTEYELCTTAIRRPPPELIYTLIDKTSDERTKAPHRPRTDDPIRTSPPTAQVFIYPSRGQSPQEEQSDKGRCSVCRYRPDAVCA